jgi:DNA-binding SARP family transcriptional activator/TolB-like protein
VLGVRLLGGASVERDADPLTGPATQRHRLALLALLATSHPGGLTRDKLLAYLWPTRADESARNLLNQSVYVLRKALGEDAILSVGEELRLDPRAVRVDVLEFEEALADGDPERAVELYRGPFLDGFFLPDAAEFERRVDADRARLRDRYRKALEGLAEASAAGGDASGAVEWWRRAAVEDPYNSRVALKLMRALERTGARGEALRHARVHALLLEQELGAEPDPAVTELAERIRTDPRCSPVSEGPGADARPRSSDGARTAADPGHGPGESGVGGGPPPPGREPAAPVGTAAAPGGGRTDRATSDETAVPEERSAPAEPAAPPSPRHRRRSRRAAWGLTGAAVLALAGWMTVHAFSADGPGVERVAVLPLADLTGNPRQDHFVAGMHDALVTELGRIADLTVVSRQSVLRYRRSDEPLPAIARELGVDAVVEGAVFRSGDSVRITAQLIRGDPEEHLWAGTYRGSLGEALALQGEVAREIAGAVHASTRQEPEARLAEERSVDPEAQEAYLLGRYHLERMLLGNLPDGEPRATLGTAVGHLEEAVELEPEWAAAHAQLALAYHWLASISPAAEDTLYPKSERSALRALELDGSEARAHASLGFVRFFFERDWEAAERAYRRALELDPNGHHADYAVYLGAAGRYDEAVSHFREAEERNPMSRFLKGQLARALFCAGRYDEAVAQARLTARLWPEGDAAAEAGLLGNAYTVQAMHAEAIAQFERAVALSDSASWAISGLAYARARAGDLREARRILTGHGPVGDPILYVALGETGRAVTMVESDVRERGLRALGDLRCFPEWRTLRARPRIREVLRRIGLSG